MSIYGCMHAYVIMYVLYECMYESVCIYVGILNFQVCMYLCMCAYVCFPDIYAYNIGVFMQECMRAYMYV